MRARRKISDSRRREILGELGGACFYCGEYATEVDHVVPYSYLANNSSPNLVPACWICNRIAGNKNFDSLSDKKAYILRQRATPKWERKIAGMVRTVIVSAIPTPKREKPPKPKKEQRQKPERKRREIRMTAHEPKPQKPIVDKPPKVEVENKTSSAPIYEYSERDMAIRFILSNDCTNDDADVIMCALIDRDMGVRIDDDDDEYDDCTPDRSVGGE